MVLDCELEVDGGPRGFTMFTMFTVAPPTNGMMEPDVNKGSHESSSGIRFISRGCCCCGTSENNTLVSLFLNEVLGGVEEVVDGP